MLQIRYDVADYSRLVYILLFYSICGLLSVFRLKEKLLPKILLSEIQMMLDKGVNGEREQFLHQVDGWLTDKDKSSYLSRQYCEELAAIFLIQNNVARAQHQVECSLTAFLNSWTELNPLSHKLRTKQLLDVQKTAELQVCGFTALNAIHLSK
jgi:hypothetical protein